MPTFQSKPIQVDAISANEAITKGKSEWSALPTWVKKAYQDGKILFGASEIHISDKYSNESAKGEDVIIHHQNGLIEVLSDKEFNARYESLVHEQT